MRHTFTQITLRGLDTQLSQFLRKLAKTEGLSLNQTALRLLKKAAGLSEEKPETGIGTSLDSLFGTWTKEQAKEFEQSQRHFEKIDQDLWD